MGLGFDSQRQMLDECYSGLQLVKNMVSTLMTFVCIVILLFIEEESIIDR